MSVLYCSHILTGIECSSNSPWKLWFTLAPCSLMLLCGEVMALQKIFFVTNATMISTSSPPPAEAPMTTYFWLVCGAAVASFSDVNGDEMSVVALFWVFSVPKKRFRYKLSNLLWKAVHSAFSGSSAQTQTITQVEGKLTYHRVAASVAMLYSHL